MFALSILSSFKHYNANLKEQTAHILFDFALFIEIDSKANDLSFSTGMLWSRQDTQLLTGVQGITKTLFKRSMHMDHFCDYIYLKPIVSNWEFDKMNFYSTES